MAIPDLNLLVTLDVLLAEGSVARAARRLRLSPSAMSRSLARLRDTMGDPLLVRAGRGLVPTPRALELRQRIGPLVQEAAGVLRPGEALDPARLARTFTLRTSDGFVESFGPDLMVRVGAEAPGVRLRFLAKANKDSTLLRDGTVDLETGVVDDRIGPEIRTLALFDDRYVGVVRAGHPLSRGKITPARYAAPRHVVFSHSGDARGLVDERLAALGLQREIAAIVGGFTTALALARRSDLVATVPSRHTETLREDMFSFALPFQPPEITVSMLWHPRMDADAGHRWLRGCVRDVCADKGRAAARRSRSGV
ncbi:LysR family transcriptional regulator [Bradyrhizobium sp. U87765 SZCCT0131]|uniref:LysR family transcriptional regulator n=1 Tax=unclassified Bradyrhizobium TaxID=2631580 RepID=UPI001BA92B85|nr:MULTISPECIES: LysR family transcriptional regulator [unclassified Bradyrhizobium]MBR1220594.1 LysR family transcriptional regulator [Bradyrhizobium sp. U87765 SZCCT0131]MBR1262952.1 LysR family transcriptional regulator [Bradyrhizobium sp. U87765 SZCCT0134]MBR1307166.1 LysR family transcriptional regulator [Bradyrhizobium sp. U87765 SZCCT0110]MBR1322947.1 LysR family transcriptional regulator [Bradyrhizobium sp. U87765 SZCCT0109]MBR1346120.1 LysR family transcriptional regulator [Bradyrhizo